MCISFLLRVHNNISLIQDKTPPDWYLWLTDVQYDCKRVLIMHWVANGVGKSLPAFVRGWDAVTLISWFGCKEVMAVQR